MNIKIALQSVKSNLLRTVLTIFIIAIGITALVGILTAIDSIKGSTMITSPKWALILLLRNKGAKVRAGKGVKPKSYPNITFAEALKFKERFNTTAFTLSYFC